MGLRRIAIVLTAIAMISALFAGTGGAVTFGEPDDWEHPFVGLVYFEITSGVFRCSGTLIAPTVVLTAGHCTEEFGEASTRSWVTFDEEVVIPDHVLQLPDDEFGDWLDGQDNFIKGTGVPHPLYDDYSAFPLVYDIGVVVLEEPVTHLGFGRLPDGNMLDGLRGQAKRDFHVVGYGLQGLVNPFFGADRARYKADVRLVETKSAFTAKGLASAKFTNNPGGGTGGSCFGDSGGPVFRSDDVIVAIVAFGFTPCIGVDYQYRVDIDDSLSFLAQFMNT